MKITLTHPEVDKTYQIRTYGNGLCYEIFTDPDKVRISRKNGKEYKQYGVSIGRYPANLEAALSMTVDLMQKKSNTEIEIDISKEIEKISDFYSKWLEDLSISIEK